MLILGCCSVTEANLTNLLCNVTHRQQGGWSAATGAEAEAGAGTFLPQLYRGSISWLRTAPTSET